MIACGAGSGGRAFDTCVGCRFTGHLVFVGVVGVVGAVGAVGAARRSQFCRRVSLAGNSSAVQHHGIPIPGPLEPFFVTGVISSVVPFECCY